MTAMPARTTRNWFLTRSRRVIPSRSRREDDENMQTIEKSTRRSTMIHTTLSPSKWSANVQKLVFFFFASAISYRCRTASLN